MNTRGTVYLVRAQRRDNGWINFRTCDRTEAGMIARRLGVPVIVDRAA